MADAALLKKLGIKDGSTVLMTGCPQVLQPSLGVSRASSNPDVILAFVRDRQALAQALPVAMAAYGRGAVLWFAYPKKSGSIASDITRDKGWELLAEQDLLPVTQVAIDADWSALRFRYRDEIGKLTRSTDFPGQADKAK